MVISRIVLIFQPIDSFGFHESKRYVKLLALLQMLRYLRLFLSTKLTFNPEVFADAYGNTQLFDCNMFYYSFMKCLSAATLYGCLHPAKIKNYIYCMCSHLNIL